MIRLEVGPDTLPNSLVKRPAELDFGGEIVNAEPTSGSGDMVRGFDAPDIHIHERRGALAQYIAVKLGELVKHPEFLTIVKGCGVIEVGLIAYQTLFKVAKLRRQPGQSIFVGGGSTSVGTYAIQLAKLYGFKMAVSASPKKAKLVAELGVEYALLNGREAPGLTDPAQ